MKKRTLGKNTNGRPGLWGREVGVAGQAAHVAGERVLRAAPKPALLAGVQFPERLWVPYTGRGRMGVGCPCRVYGLQTHWVTGACMHRHTCAHLEMPRGKGSTWEHMAGSPRTPGALTPSVDAMGELSSNIGSHPAHGDAEWGQNQFQVPQLSTASVCDKSRLWGDMRTSGRIQVCPEAPQVHARASWMPQALSLSWQRPNSNNPAQSSGLGFWHLEQIRVRWIGNPQGR